MEAITSLQELLFPASVIWLNIIKVSQLFKKIIYQILANIENISAFQIQIDLDLQNKLCQG